MSASAPSTAPPPGMYVPTVTFFNPNLSLDIRTQVAYSQNLAHCGIRGLILLGSTGESSFLSPADRTALISAIRSALPRPYPLIAGATTSSTHETITLLNASHAAGADYGLVLAPGYFAGAGGEVDHAAIQSWYETVADGSKMPILVYTYPAVSNGLVIDPGVLAKLSKHPKIVGIKLSHGDVGEYARLLLRPDVEKDSSKWRVFTGLGGILGCVKGLGVQGAIDSLAGVVPKTMVRLWEMVERGEDGEELRGLMWRIAEAETMVAKGGVGAVKAALVESGLGESVARGLIKVEGERWRGVLEKVLEVEGRL